MESRVLANEDSQGNRAGDIHVGPILLALQMPVSELSANLKLGKFPRKPAFRDPDSPNFKEASSSPEGVSPLQLEPSVATRKRCKGTKKDGAACTAWATEGGLCYFHANPDKAVELGRSGGLRRQHTFEQPTEQIAPPESAADVRRMLAKVMADIRAGKMDPELGTTLGYVGTAADACILPRVSTGNTMAPCVVIGEQAAALLRRERDSHVAT